MPRHKDDLTGKRFGKLTVIKKSDKDKMFGKKIIPTWDCVCDCGNLIKTISPSLKAGLTQSCGCILKEKDSKSVSINGQNIMKYFDDTQITQIMSKTVRKDNSSGIRGVTWNNRSQKWIARITVQRCVYRLGGYAKLEDAAKARKLAEELYFEPVIEKYKKETEA